MNINLHTTVQLDVPSTSWKSLIWANDESLTSLIKRQVSGARLLVDEEFYNRMHCKFENDEIYLISSSDSSPVYWKVGSSGDKTSRIESLDDILVDGIRIVTGHDLKVTPTLEYLHLYHPYYSRNNRIYGDKTIQHEDLIAPGRVCESKVTSQRDGRSDLIIRHPAA